MLSGRLIFLLLSHGDSIYVLNEFALGSTDTWRQLAGYVYGFQGYVNNLLRLECSYANKRTVNMNNYIHDCTFSSRDTF